MYDKPLGVDKHEAFALALVRLNNASAAWREVYDPQGDHPARVSWENGCRLSNHIHIGRRIEWLRGQLLERSQISVAAMLQDLHDIATADPRELCAAVVGACRHCHGIGFKYQWIDADEFASACEAVEALNVQFPKARKPLPSFDGGTGYEAHRAPNAMCPECMGIGRVEWRVTDTSLLSEKARKLFTGTFDKYGRPQMHDQLHARDQLHKLLGAYKTNADGQSLAPGVAPVGTDGKPAGDPSQTYLGMVHGGRRA